MNLNRRGLFKVSGAVLGAVAFSDLISSPAYAREVFVPSEKTPLLLNFNENAIGMAPSAKEAVQACLGTAFRYPDALRGSLVDALATKWSMTQDHIIIGNGSSEVIQGAVQAIAHYAADQKKPVQLVVPDPTFNYAEIYAGAQSIPVVKVALKAPNYTLDLDRMRQKVRDFPGISIVYLCNPNNPTATITPSVLLEDWYQSASKDTYFIVDEAYAEFVTDPAFKSADTIVKGGNKRIVVTRTFSKLYALAGLRVGYGLAHPDLATLINGFMSIDNTNAAGAAAALASLNDAVFVEKSLQSTNLSRKIVTDALDELGLRYLPSQANFIFHEIKGEHQMYKDRMAAAHVFVGRAFPPIENFNRLTLGTPDEMRAFVTVLKSFRQKGWI